MQSTHPTGTHRVCYQCDNPPKESSLFCAECAPDRMPPIIREKPMPSYKPTIGDMASVLLRPRLAAKCIGGQAKELQELRPMVASLQRDLSEIHKEVATLRRMLKSKSVELEELAKAFDEIESERSKLSRKVTSIAIDWAPVTEIALKHLGSSAEMPAIAAWVADRLSPPSAGQNADTAVSEQSAALPAPLGQNPETEIAPGHNPDRLTVAQVGEGWRLLTPSEVAHGHSFEYHEVDGWFDSEWNKTGWNGNMTQYTYRVRI